MTDLVRLLTVGLVGYSAAITAYAVRLSIARRQSLIEIKAALRSIAQPLDAPLVRGIVEPADAVAHGTRATVASLSRKTGLP